MPKIDKEELRKYLQNSDDESQQNKTSPQKSKRVLHKIKTFLKINQRKSSSKILLKIILPKVKISKTFRKRQKNLVTHLLSIPKEKIINT